MNVAFLFRDTEDKPAAPTDKIALINEIKSIVKLKRLLLARYDDLLCVVDNFQASHN